MKRNKIWFVIAILVISALLLVACEDVPVPTPTEHTHTYGAWTITTKPTATTDGSATRECSCGENETVTVAKLTDADVWAVEVKQDATHASNGYAVYTSIYGTVTTTSNQEEHVYGNWTITKNPTETETGLAIKICTCGHSVVEDVPVLSNNIWQKDDSNRPSHDADGSVVYTSDYGTVTVVVPAGEHVYGKWTDNKNGTHTRSCDCGKGETAAHVFDQRVANSNTKKADATCTNGAEYYYSCVCGAVGTETFFSGEGTGHSFSEFVLTKAPTCTETGLASVKCTKCNYENDNSVIAALGHTWDTVWHPYFGNEQYQDPDTGEVIVDEDTTSEYHAHACTVCGIFDKDNKVAHTYGDAYIVASKSNTYTQMSTEHACDCGYTEVVNDNLGFLEYWTKGTEIPANYNSAGSIVYTKEGGYTYTLVLPKLVAPYDGKTYYFVEAELRDGLTIGGASIYSWTTASVTLDANGEGVGTANPVKGNNKVTMKDAATGKITWDVTDSEGKTTTYNGYVDMSTGIVVISSETPFTKCVYIGSWLENGALDAKVFAGSVWGSNMAVCYKHNCSIGEHEFNVYINEDGVVTFGVDFVDVNGSTISAGDIHSANYVKITKDGTKLVAFAKNKAGNFVETDGLEGTYTCADVDDTEAPDFIVDGIGGINYYTSSTNVAIGTYTAVEGEDYYDVYCVAADSSLYIRVTFNVTAKTYTYDMPMTTVTYVTEHGTVEDSYKQVNTNIKFTLPNLGTIEADGKEYVFMGWKLQDASSVDDYITEYTPTTDEVTFVATWVEGVRNITIKDAQGEDKLLKVGKGSPILSAEGIPDYTSETVKNGYIFQGWYIDNGDGIIDEDDELVDSTTTVTDNITIISVWEWAGNVTFEEQTEYAWEYVAETNSFRSTNWHVGSKSSTMQINWASGTTVIEFDYWVTGEHGYDYLTIWYNNEAGERVSISTKGSDITSDKAVHFKATLTKAGQSVQLSYSKDSGGDGDAGEEDRAFIVNLTINGISVGAQQPLNKDIVGTYTTSDDTTVVVSAGGLVTVDGVVTTYTIVDTNVIGIVLADDYKEITLNKADNTCTIVVPQVDVTYNYNGHGNNTTTSVNKLSTQTLSTDVPTDDNVIFRGWYIDEDCTIEADATFVAKDNVIFYAKWDKAVTITYVYNDGTHSNTTDATYYANDKVTVLQAVDFNYGTKVFAGWYTKDGSTSGDWEGDAYAVGTTIEDNLTLYAQWVEPSPFAGTYTILRFYNNKTEPNDVWNSDTQKLVIDNFGNGTVTAWNGFSNGYVVSIAFVEGSTSVVTITAGSPSSTYRFSYYGVYDATSGVIVRADNKTGFGSIIYLMVPYNSAYAKADFAVFTWDENSVCRKLISFADRNADNATRTIFIESATNVVFGATWSAKDAQYEDVASLADVKENASMLNVTTGATTYKYAKNSSNKFVVLTDELQGRYGNKTAKYIVLNGAGVIAINDSDVVTGTYTVNDDGTITALTSNACYTITLNGDEYTMADNKVTITYVNEHVTVDSVNVYSGIKYTLVTDGLTVDGFIFRGWYENADFSGNKVTNVTPAENKTYYAKYDAEVTLTFDYNGYVDTDNDNATLQVVADKYVNDTVGTLPTTLDSATNGTKVFVGWFTANGTDDNWGDQVTTSTKLTDTTTTYYAKWIEPAAAAGTYKGFEIWNASSGKETTSFNTTVLTLNATGTFTGIKSISGTLSADDFDKINSAINLTRYAYVSDALGGIVILGCNYNANSVGADYYIGFKNYANITKVDYSADSVGGIYTTWITVSYKDGDVTKEMNLFIYRDVITANVSWTDSISAKDCAKADSVFMYDENGNAFIKKSGSVMVDNDDMGGTYTASTDDGIGSIVLDGYGSVTIGDNTVAYTLDSGKISFVNGNRMYVLTLDKDSLNYTQVQDAYQGEYTMPDGTTKITLNGYGCVAGTAQTYVVSGETITIYNGETSVAYGIDTNTKTLLGKSIFAGLTFSGTYYDEWDGSNNSISFIFDDSSTLSGRLERGSWKSKFTATFDGTTLIITITENVEYCRDWVGNTIEATLSGNTFTITKCWKTSGTYTFANNGTLTCPDYAA